jgi:hypothetical protein
MTAHKILDVPNSLLRINYTGFNVQLRQLTTQYAANVAAVLQTRVFLSTSI